MGPLESLRPQKVVICVKNKLHVCTYSIVRFTLRFVNLFVEFSQVCGAAVAYIAASS